MLPINQRLLVWRECLCDVVQLHLILCPMLVRLEIIVSRDILSNTKRQFNFFFFCRAFDKCVILFDVTMCKWRRTWHSKAFSSKFSAIEKKTTATTFCTKRQWRTNFWVIKYCIQRLGVAWIIGEFLTSKIGVGRQSL